MAITTLDGLVQALATGQQRSYHKKSATSFAAGFAHSLWNVAGAPGSGFVPVTGSGELCSVSTTGAIPFTNSGTSYLAQATFAGSTSGRLIIYDRLWANSGLSGTMAVTNNIDTPPDLNRPDSTGANTELWAEVYATIGNTAATLSVTYNNQDGNSRTGTYVKATGQPIAGTMLPISLASGDTGVRKVTSYSWSVSTGTAGNFGFTILRRIAEFPLNLINNGILLDFADLGLPVIYNSACLSAMVLCSTTNTGFIIGSITIAQG